MKIKDNPTLTTRITGLTDNSLMGNRIKVLKTPVEFAKCMGVMSQAYMVRIELGDVKPTQAQIEVIKSFVGWKL